jgi:recombination protein RecA
LLHNEGISREGDLIDTGVEMNVVEKRGAFYSFNGTRLAQGRENARTFLRENPAMLEDIEKAIRAKAGLGGAAIPSPKAELDDEDKDEEEEEEEEETEGEE